MFKKWALLTISAVLISVTKLVALPIGNPLDASWIEEGIIWAGPCYCDVCDPCVTWCDALSARFGFYGDYVFDRYLEIDRGRDDSNLRRSEIFTNAAYFAANLYHRFDLFATVGQSKLRIETPASAWVALNYTNLDSVMETEWYFSWSLGARATIWECRCFGLGAEFQYFASNPHMNYFQIDSEAPFYFDNARIRYREYQLGVGATYTIPLSCSSFVVPYVGVKFAHAYVDLGDFRFVVSNVTYELYDLENETTTGVALGTTIVGCQEWSLTAEIRFIDELALHINSQLRF